MKVSTERTPNCSAIITVEIDDEQLQRALQNAAARVSKIRPIPGFRPGKAPYARVERAVGKDLLLDEAIEGLAQSIYKQVLKDENIEPYDAGKMEVVQKEPAILKFTIPTRPVVTLGDYRSLHLQPNPVEVSDDDINRVLDQLRDQQATMTPVTRAAQMGDLMTINVKGGIEGQTPLDREGLEVRLQKEGAIFPWLEQLVGANANEPLTVHYTYPEDSNNKDIAGKTATYSVTATDIKEMQLPELNDEFAKSVSMFETLDLLKARIRSNLFAEKQGEEENRFADEVVDTVVAQSQIAYPESMLEDETASEVTRSKDIAQRLGLTWDKYLQLAGKDESAYLAEMKPRAEQRLKRLLTLMQVVEQEKILVSSKEVDVEIDLRAQDAARQGERADQTRRTLATPDSRRDIEFTLKVRKAIDFVVASAKGEPTSGKILTPEMVRQEELARAQAAAAANAPSFQPGELITDPSQVRSGDMPSQMGKILLPGQE